MDKSTLRKKLSIRLSKNPFMDIVRKIFRLGPSMGILQDWINSVMNSVSGIASESIEKAKELGKESIDSFKGIALKHIVQNGVPEETFSAITALAQKSKEQGLKLLAKFGIKEETISTAIVYGRMLFSLLKSAAQEKSEAKPQATPATALQSRKAATVPTQQPANIVSIGRGQDSVTLGDKSNPEEELDLQQLMALLSLLQPPVAAGATGIGNVTVSPKPEIVKPVEGKATAPAPITQTAPKVASLAPTPAVVKTASVVAANQNSKPVQVSPYVPTKFTGPTAVTAPKPAVTPIAGNYAQHVVNNRVANPAQQTTVGKI